MAKVALRFGCAKQSKNLEWYLLIRYLVKDMKILMDHLVFKVKTKLNVKHEILIFTDSTERHD